MFSEDGRCEFQDDGFQLEWDLIAQFLGTESFDYVTIAPLPRFVAPFPVTISENILIDRLTDEEVNRCVRAGILRSVHDEWIDGASAVGIRFTTRIEKVVGKADPVSKTGSFGRRCSGDAPTIADDVLTALRLFKQGRVQCPGTVSGVQAWFLGAALSFGSRVSDPVSFNNYELGEGEVEGLQNLWRDLTDGRLEGRRFFDMALRRFNIAFERRQPDDQIVDLMIAAESLFLDRSNRGEQRFRLALRAAKFVESPRYDPRQVFALMREAYDRRSDLVHGGFIKKVKLPDKPDATLHDLVLASEEILRLGIWKALADPEVGREGYWEDLLFDKIENEPE